MMGTGRFDKMNRFVSGECKGTNCLLVVPCHKDYCDFYDLLFGVSRSID